MAGVLATILAEATDSRTRALGVANATMRANVENVARLQQMAQELRQPIAYCKRA